MIFLPTIRRVVGITGAVLMLLGVIGLASRANAQVGDHVLTIDITGPITNVTSDFLDRALEKTEADEAALLVLRVDTPGGLLDATRTIVGLLLAAGVPTAALVAPEGSRAGSAGTFIVAATNVAAMVPGTNIGAASPVGGGGGEELPETLQNKVTNDAAALMRDIAEQRERNSEKLEETVTTAVAFSSSEAVAEGVIDLVVPNMAGLLEQLDGRVVTVDGEPVTLTTRGLPVRKIEENILELFLSVLADPNLSFLLLSLGSLGLVVEFWNPGILIPGIAGAILLILAFLGLGNLNANWAGVLLILLAGVLAVLEVYIAGFGAAGVGAMIAFVLGSFVLFAQFGTPSPTAPSIGFRISPWVLYPTLTLVVGSGTAFLYVVRQASKRRPEAETHPLIGAIGEAVIELSPRGSVRVGGELWTALVAGGGKIGSGDAVRVIDVDGVTTTVEALEPEISNGDNENPVN
jgi:membrane-bound serine protease (ClpP class)